VSTEDIVLEELRENKKRKYLSENLEFWHNMSYVVQSSENTVKVIVNSQLATHGTTSRPQFTLENTHRDTV
jgi:hypothetical protein